MANKEWGEKIWEDKIKTQGPLGVINGSNTSKKTLDKRVKYFMDILKKDFLPSIKIGADVMDAGIGPLANYSIRLSKIGYSLTGVDISETTLESAKIISMKNHVKINFIKDDLTTLEKVGKKFDLVFCFDTFGHIPSYLALETMRAFNDKIRSGGYCIVHFWIDSEKTFKNNLYDFLYWNLHLIKKRFKKVFPVNCSKYNSNEILDMIEKSEFSYVKNFDGIYLMKKK